jgi:hypothetical protein
MAVPKKVADRISGGLKNFKPVLESAKARDVNESDTSMIVTDMLAAEGLTRLEKWSPATTTRFHGSGRRQVWTASTRL